MTGIMVYNLSIHHQTISVSVFSNSLKENRSGGRNIDQYLVVI